MEVEQVNLRSIVISNSEWERREIVFEQAKLMLVTEYGDRFWYIDVDGVADRELLEWLAHSEDIRIAFVADSDRGETLQGTAYAHPNASNSALAIRGEGELQRL